MSRATTTGAPVMQPQAKPTMPQGQTPQTQTTSLPTERVAKLAYEKWMKGGCKHGCDQQHWLEAEAEVRTEMMRTGAKR